MSVDLIALLENHVNDQKIGTVAVKALELIHDSTQKSQHVSSNSQSSNSVARLYKFRKKMGKMKAGIVGLDEMIATLSEREFAVKLGHVDTERGIVAIWFTEDPNYPAGIMVMSGVGSEIVNSN